MTNDENSLNGPPFDLERATDMISKRVVIGLTYYDHEGTSLEQKQMHGKIVSVDARHGLEVELEGSHQGEIFWIPPNLQSFQEAKPGEYRERSTGEIVINPDLLTTWEVIKPPPKHKAKK